MSACALFIIGITRSWRDRSRRRMRQRDIRRTAGFRHDPKTRSAAATRPLALDVSDDDCRRHRRREARVMKSRRDPCARSGRRCRRCLSTDGRTDADPDTASRTAPCIAMAAGLSSSCRIAFSTSPLRVSISRSGNAGCITISPTSSSIASKSSERHVQLMFITCRFALTDSDTPRSSSASAISSVVLALGAAVEHPRRQMAEADERVRVVNAAGLDADVNGHRRNGARFLRDDDRAVVEHVARRRKSLLDVAVVMPALHPVGLNQPTVRRSVRRYFFATLFDLFCGHRGDAVRRVSIDVEAGDRLKVPELVAEVRDAVVFEHQARAKLVLRLHKLAVGDARRAHLVQRRRRRAPRLPRG